MLKSFLIAAFVTGATLLIYMMFMHQSPEKTSIIESTVVRPPANPDLAPDSFMHYDSPPKLLPGFQATPAYPEKAKGQGIAGKVQVKLYINAKGEVEKSSILKATPVGMGFEEEVLKVVPTWKFEPAQRGQKAVGVWIVMPVNFGVE